MLRDIAGILDGDAHAARQTFLNRTQHCFAVRNGCNGLLDVARATFCRVTEEIHTLVAGYREDHGLEIKVSSS